MLQANQYTSNKYNLKFYYDVEKFGNVEEIDEKTISLINNLAKSWSTKLSKTPIFKKSEIQ